MQLYNSSEEYMYNLYTTSSGEARRIWKNLIKEKWNFECAYCGSNENLTIDHIIPQAKGGNDFTPNVVCCCESCNKDKGHKDWEDWYIWQPFFTPERRSAILDWMKPNKTQGLHRYGNRKNIVK